MKQGVCSGKKYRRLPFVPVEPQPKTDLLRGVMVPSWYFLAWAAGEQSINVASMSQTVTNQL